LRAQGAIHRLGNEGSREPIADLGVLPLPRPFQSPGEVLDIDKRLLLIPEARVLIVLPATDDRVVIHRITLPGAGP
jgi:hypothetical protein